MAENNDKTDINELIFSNIVSYNLIYPTNLPEST